MQQISSRENSSFSVTNEIPRILWNPNVYLRVHKGPQLVSFLSQVNPVHAVPSYLFKIYFNIILALFCTYEGWNFNSGNYLFTTDTK